MQVFNKLLSDEGYLILSVPYRCKGKAEIEYNSQRIYSTKAIDAMLKDNGFEIIDFVQIDPHLILPIKNEGEQKYQHIPLHRLKNEDIIVEHPPGVTPGVYITLSKKVNKD